MNASAELLPDMRSGCAGRPGASMQPESLRPITARDWGRAHARHLLERAGFGGTPEDVDRLAAMTPDEAVSWFVDYDRQPGAMLPPFEESGFWDPGLANFPVSRPFATELAAREGAAIGARVKPSGARPLQPVVDRFFYWLRATVFETRRLAHWWVDRMIRTPRPLEEKMTLFWHGYFATGEEKLRDYRKMLVQLETLRQGATGNFADLLLAIARDPAMLTYLDAGKNVKGAPNENFGREVMELFTMGVGNYTEKDIREASRAFTGWTNDELEFVMDSDRHDDGLKEFLGRKGHFCGEDILGIILEQPQTAEFIAAKIHRFFVRDETSTEFRTQLGNLLRQNGYEIAPFLRSLFLSEDFYSTPSTGAHVKFPTELIVSTYRRLGVAELPGIPDLHTVSQTLGQVLLNPPTVAGWGEGKAWITPGLLFERANFAREVMFPNMIEFKDPYFDAGDELRRVNRNILAGQEITEATLEENATPNSSAGIQETFNTRYASLVGWQEALRKLKPTPRGAAQFSLSEIILDAGATTTTDAVARLLEQFLVVPIEPEAEAKLVDFLDAELGTSSLDAARSYLETPLRTVAHLIMSTPQYQLA